ncbi:hypothetical protein AUP68_18043 [Ilyonectria robusta]
MRLIDVSTITLKDFVGQNIPRYAILSHTWGEDELLFEDLNRGTPKRGLQKVLDTCRQAKLDNIDYVWVDTCCIDRSSSAELSEAINSMFKWYNKSAACYVYMEDVVLAQDGSTINMVNFDSSRWFTRGWTLQELIAPHELQFFDRDWKKMQSRHELAQRLSNITGIHTDILSRRHRLERPVLLLRRNNHSTNCPACKAYDGLALYLGNETIATKMKWAANRVTTREEDIAYCLLGLFDINMPLLYGEGKNAFLRLQEEILRKAPDQTILTWTESFLRRGRQISYLPEHPSSFQFELGKGTDGRFPRNDIITTPRGLEVDVMLGPCVVARFHDNQTEKQFNKWLAVLSCPVDVDHTSRVAILVAPIDNESPAAGYRREHKESLIALKAGERPRVLENIVPSFPSIRRQPGDMSVDCDFDEFTPQRIYLPSLELSLGSFEERRQVKMTFHGYGNWHLEAQEPHFFKGEAILKPEFLVGESLIDNIRVAGVFFFANDETGFFVVWGVTGSDSYERGLSNAHQVCWIEPWESFFHGDLSCLATGDGMDETLRTVRENYVKQYTEHPFVKPASELMGLGFHAKACIELSEFLGRKWYTISVKIEQT